MGSTFQQRLGVNRSGFTLAFTHKVMPGLTAAALSLVILGGCGGGGDSAPPSITNAVIVTNPTPITYTGGVATISAKVADSAGVDPATVKIDIIGPGGTSVIGGPQLMNWQLNPVDTYSYPITLPNNLTGTTSKVYTASVTAADTKGNITRTPVAVGSITIPFPPAPPGSP